MEFEWDEIKAEANVQKHEVTFEEAVSVFSDPLSETGPDESHSEDGTRFITVGVSHYGSLLVVVHTDRKGKTRIISARSASRAEKRLFESGN